MRKLYGNGCVEAGGWGERNEQEQGKRERKMVMEKGMDEGEEEGEERKG